MQAGNKVQKDWPKGSKLQGGITSETINERMKKKFPSQTRKKDRKRKIDIPKERFLPCRGGGGMEGGGTKASDQPWVAGEEKKPLSGEERKKTNGGRGGDLSVSQKKGGPRRGKRIKSNRRGKTKKR